jgi:hypothetical protein
MNIHELSSVWDFVVIAVSAVALPGRGFRVGKKAAANREGYA